MAGLCVAQGEHLPWPAEVYSADIRSTVWASQYPSRASAFVVESQSNYSEAKLWAGQCAARVSSRLCASSLWHPVLSAVRNSECVL